MLSGSRIFQSQNLRKAAGQSPCRSPLALDHHSEFFRRTQPNRSITNPHFPHSQIQYTPFYRKHQLGAVFLQQIQKKLF